MGSSVKLSSCVGIGHNWTDCSQTGKYWVRFGMLMWISPGSAGPDLMEDQGSPHSLLPSTLTGTCPNLPCLPISWHWRGVQWWYVLGMCPAGSGVPQRGSCSGTGVLDAEGQLEAEMTWGWCCSLLLPSISEAGEQEQFGGISFLLNPWRGKVGSAFCKRKQTFVRKLRPSTALYYHTWPRETVPMQTGFYTSKSNNPNF